MYSIGCRGDEGWVSKLGTIEIDEAVRVALSGSCSGGEDIEKGGVNENEKSDGVGDDIAWVDGEVSKDGVYECNRDGVGGDESRMEGELEHANDGEGGVGRRDRVAHAISEISGEEDLLGHVSDEKKSKTVVSCGLQ